MTKVITRNRAALKTLKMNNLKPFTGTNDLRRQNGRKTGSKNISTIVREILDSNIDTKLPLNDYMKEIVSNNNSTTYAKAMSLSMIIKAINGNVRAADWVTNQYNISPSPDNFFRAADIHFHVVSSKAKSAADEEES